MDRANDTPTMTAWHAADSEILALVWTEAKARFVFAGLEGEALWEMARECATWMEARVHELRRECGVEVKHGNA